MDNSHTMKRLSNESKDKQKQQVNSTRGIKGNQHAAGNAAFTRLHS